LSRLYGKSTHLGFGNRQAIMEFSIDHLGIAVKSLAAAKSIYE
jgi:hypothetical protein